MIRFFDMLSSVGGFRARLERKGNTLGLRPKAAHEAVVGTTEARMEAAV